MPEYLHSHDSERILADRIRQIVFGLGHGLISTLGLSIGVVSASGNSRTVVIAGVVGLLTGLATLAALQYLSAKTQKEIYEHMIEEEKIEFTEHPEVEKSEMRAYYIDEGFSAEESDLFVNRLTLDRDRWVKAHVTHVLEFIPAKNVSPARESVTLGLSHLLGGTIVLIPYLLLAELDFAALVSTVLAAGTLFMTGLFKTKATGGRWYMGAAEFVLIGMGALATGYLVGSVVRGVL